MAFLSEAALLGNKHNIIAVCHSCAAEIHHISLHYLKNIVTFCFPFHFRMLELVAKINPVVVFKSFHVIILSKAAFAQESICSFYVYADNESK